MGIRFSRLKVSILASWSCALFYLSCFVVVTSQFLLSISRSSTPSVIVFSFYFCLFLVLVYILCVFSFFYSLSLARSSFRLDWTLCLLRMLLLSFSLWLIYLSQSISQYFLPFPSGLSHVCFFNVFSRLVHYYYEKSFDESHLLNLPSIRSRTKHVGFW